MSFGAGDAPPTSGGGVAAYPSHRIVGGYPPCEAEMRSVAAAILLVLAACSTLADDLARAERLYDDARYEAALEWLRALEAEVTDASTRDRLRLSYLRGMTAYRLGERDEALYQLSVTAVLADREPDALDANRREVLARTLAELTPIDATHEARRKP